MMAEHPMVGPLFVRSMEGKTILLTGPDFRQLCQSTLPPPTYSLLVDSMVKNRIRWRHQSPDDQKSMSLEPEVIVGEEDRTPEDRWIYSNLEGYLDTTPVARRRDLHERVEHVRDRSEFWEWLLEPVIEAFPSTNREIDIIDQYLFQDFRRELNRTKSKSPRRLLHHIGVVWLLSQINSLCQGEPHRTVVKIYTAEKGARHSKSASDALDQAEIAELFQTLLDHEPLENLDFHVTIVPATKANPRPLGFEMRQLLVNRMMGFTFGHGVGGLTTVTLPDGSRGDRSPSTWTWLPGVSKADLAAIKSLEEDAIYLEA